ncbi:hypothetical protein ASF78_10830 [Cellulomonas sp. Leaf334]|nr:hypothetical protein ASF78_10830 [Cellulomonas sp. Leaf334]
MTAVLAAVATAALAACGPSGTSLPFAVAASTVDYSGDEARVVAQQADVEEEWLELDGQSWPELGDGRVRLMVVPGTQYRDPDVTDVRVVDGAWVVDLTAYDAAECTGVDVVMSSAFLVDVEAAAPPSSVSQQVDVQGGCG